MSSKVLYGEKVSLRPISDTDLLKMAQWEADPELRYLMGQLIEEMKELDWYSQMRQERNCRLFAIDAKGIGLIGDIELAHIAWRSGEAELIVRIGEKEYWGQGYGTDAVTLFLQYAFTVLNLKYVYLRVYNYNRRAIRCYEKCGFKKEAFLRVNKSRKDKRASTIILMNVLRDEFLSAFSIGEHQRASENYMVDDLFL